MCWSRRCSVMRAAGSWRAGRSARWRRPGSRWISCRTTSPTRRRRARCAGCTISSIRCPVQGGQLLRARVRRQHPLERPRHRRRMAHRSRHPVGQGYEGADVKGARGDVAEFRLRKIRRLDDLVDSGEGKTALQQLSALCNKKGSAVLGCQTMPEKEVSSYGVTLSCGCIVLF